LKLINHIKYFYYIASNWSLRLGFFTLLQELRGERKYGLDTTAAIHLRKLKLKGNQLKHATEYMPVNYFTLEALLRRIPEQHKQATFLDIGCGKGRAMCVAAAFGYKQVEGIDFAKQLIDAAEQNLERIKKQYPLTRYNLAWADVQELQISEQVNTIFLFNPFDEFLVKQVIKKMNRSLEKKPRPLLVLYCTPRHEHLFFDEGFEVLFRIKKFDYWEGVILEKK
jgi:SAM-dependent methyltransferase